MKSLIPNGMVRSISRQTLIAKKNSPHIFFVGGVLGVVTSAVLACRATLKLEEKLDKANIKLLAAREGSYDDKAQYTRAMVRTYSDIAVDFGKLYGPSVVLGAVSIGALTGSHVQMTKRNSALTATVALVGQAFEEYRDRVREELGEERERDIHAGITTEKRTVDGKKVDIKILDASGSSPYQFMFTQQSSYNWKDDPFYNRVFLESQQNWANERLQTRGHLFLNELLNSLGMEHTSTGALVGWVYDRDLKNDGDNYVDFGIFISEKNLEFTEGSASDVFLDFNVDGPIYDKI
jgi:hypothetical protein